MKNRTKRKKITRKAGKESKLREYSLKLVNIVKYHHLRYSVTSKHLKYPVIFCNAMIQRRRSLFPLKFQRNICSLATFSNISSLLLFKLFLLSIRVGRKANLWRKIRNRNFVQKLFETEAGTFVHLYYLNFYNFKTISIFISLKIEY